MLQSKCLACLCVGCFCSPVQFIVLYFTIHQVSCDVVTAEWNAFILIHVNHAQTPSFVQPSWNVTNRNCSSCSKLIFLFLIVNMQKWHKHSTKTAADTENNDANIMCTVTFFHVYNTAFQYNVQYHFYLLCAILFLIIISV